MQTGCEGFVRYEEAGRIEDATWERELREYRFGEMEPLPTFEDYMTQAEIENQLTTAVMLGDVELKPSQVIGWAAKASSQLAGVIRAKKLYKRISGKDFVYVEGWQTLGAMMGCFASIEEIHEPTPGCYEAWACVKRSSGAVISRASASCGTDEKLWANRTNNQRRSMAQTRAMSKALKVAFSWILVMGGFEGSTAEEMETGEELEKE